MPRIRTIKPEFWQNEELADCSAEARLLAIGLLNFSDDEGYFKASPRTIRVQIFPFQDDSTNVLGMLQELSSGGYLRLFEGSDGREYGHIVNFTKHQRVDKPKPSEIKHLEKFQEHSENVPRTFLLERKGKEVTKAYAFEGETVKISPQDLAKFEKQYPNLDIPDQLAQLDLELRGKKNWFVELNSKLNYRNKTPTHHSKQNKRIGV